MSICFISGDDQTEQVGQEKGAKGPTVVVEAAEIVDGPRHDRRDGQRFECATRNDQEQSNRGQAIGRAPWSAVRKLGTSDRLLLQCLQCSLAFVPGHSDSNVMAQSQAKKSRALR